MTLTISGCLLAFPDALRHPRLRILAVIAPRLATLRWLVLIVVCCLALPIRLHAEEKVSSKSKDFTDVDGLPTLIEPFQPPTLAELDKDKKWIARPTIDPDERFQKMVEALPKPFPLDEARKLRNTDLKTNQEIISGFLRLPDDKLQANYSESLSRHLRADVKSTNPVMQNTVQEFDMVGLIGVTLVNFDWNLEPFPDAQFIKSWDSSEDGLCERVVMRDDITWSDGRKFTAYDVAYSFRIILCPRRQFRRSVRRPKRFVGSKRTTTRRLSSSTKNLWRRTSGTATSRSFPSTFMKKPGPRI
jgi:hypothetical protein